MILSLCSRLASSQTLIRYVVWIGILWCRKTFAQQCHSKLRCTTAHPIPAIHVIRVWNESFGNVNSITVASYPGGRVVESCDAQSHNGLVLRLQRCLVM